LPSLTQRGAAGYTPGAAYRHWSSQEAFERDVLAEALCRHPGASVIETVANIRDRVDDGAELQGEIRAGAQANVHIRPQNANYFALLALRTIVSHDTELRAVRLERLMTGLSEYSYLYRGNAEGAAAAAPIAAPPWLNLDPLRRGRGRDRRRARNPSSDGALS